MMGVRKAAGMLFGGGLVVLAACGSCSSSSKHGGDDGGAEATVDAGPSPSEACAAFATAFCAQLSSCTPFALEVAYGDEGTCASRLTLACTPAFGATGTQGTPSDMEQCAAAVTAESCDDFLDNPQPSACAVPGAAPAGAACGANAQCATTYCKPAAGTVCGTCTAHAGAGGACVVDADCAATLLCNGSTCVGPGQLGAACSTTAPCLRTLTCIGGKCATPVPLNGACSAPTDCDGSHGLYCNSNTKTCQQTQIAMDGQPCGVVGSSLVACSGGASCGNITNKQGTCHQPAADNAVCGPDISCLAPAICTTTARCTLPNPSVCH